MYLNPTPARAGARASSHSSSATTSGRAACPYRGQSQRTYVRRTASTLADELGRWLFEEGCDEFNIVVPYVPEGIDDFVAKALPELPRRGLFQREYEGKTLRENLGLPRPENPLFSPSKDRSDGPFDAAPARRPLDNG
jgi:hypothetical protein